MLPCSAGIPAGLAAAGHPWPAFRIPRPGHRVGDSLSLLLLIRNRSADACVETSRVLSAGGRVKRAMDGARPSQDMDEHGLLARHCRAPERMPGALRRAGGAAAGGTRRRA